MHAPRLRTIIFVIAGGSLLLTLSLSLLLVFLPRILSSDRVQLLVRSTLSRSTNRQMSWSRLSFGWREGLLLEGLSVEGGEPPLRRLAVRRLSLVPRVGQSDGRWYLRVALHVTDPAVDLVPTPPKPPKPFTEPLSTIAEGLQRFATLSIPLAVDPGLICLIEGGTITRHDRKSPTPLTLSGITLSLSAPDLRTAPVDLHLISQVTTPFAPRRTARLDLRVVGLSDGSPRIRPAGGAITATGGMPGVTLRIAGGVEEPQGVNALLDLDLAPVAALLPHSRAAASGRVTCRLQGGADRTGNLSGEIQIATSPLTIPLPRQGKRLVLPPASLSQPFQTDAGKERVLFPRGNLTIPDLLRLAWSVTVDRPARTSRQIRGEIRDGVLQLGRTLTLFSPVIPPSAPPIRLDGTLSLGGVVIQSEPAKGGGRITLSRLLVALDHLSVRIPAGPVEGRGLSLSLTDTGVTLEPTGVFSASGSVGGSLATVGLSASSPLSVTGLSLAAGFGARGGIGSSRGLPLTVTVDQRISLDALRLGTLLSARSLSQQGKGGVTIPPDRRVTLSGLTVGLGVSSMEVTTGGKRVTLPLSIDLSSPAITLEPGKPPLIPSLTGRLTTTGLAMTLDGGVTGSERGFRGNTRVESDLARLVPAIAPLVPPVSNPGGTLTLTATVDAPLRPLPGGGSLRERLARGLDSIRSGSATLSLSSVSATLRGERGETRIRRIDTPTPISLAIDGARRLSLGGKVSVRGVRRGDTGESDADLRLFLSLADLERLDGSLDLSLPLQGVTGSLSLSAGRIGKLLEGGSVTGTSILKLLDLSSRITLRADTLSSAPPLSSGLRLSGGGSLYAELDLAGGKSLSLSLRGTSRNLGIVRKGVVTVEGVNGEILFSRRYRLVSGSEGGGWDPLSTRVLTPSPPHPTLPLGIENRLAGELRGGIAGERRVTVRRITLERGRTPLVIGPLEADLTLEPTRAGLSHFSAEMLGGTIRSTLVLDLRPELPLFSATLACSGLETALLTSSRGGGYESALAGDASLSVPLRTTPREFLEGIRGGVTIRSIGRDALERLLFSLDPEEKNEKLVSQRKLLRHGTLTFLRSDIADGALSLSGSGVVAGTSITLPSVDRVKLADLPLAGKMTPLMEGIAKLRTVLDLLRGDTIDISSGEKPLPVRRSHVSTTR